MNRIKISRPPSPYPAVLFHSIRAGQMLCSIIVMSFLAFFVHYLIEDSYYVPWTFIVLLAVSSFTNISVLVTAYFYHFRTLQPKASSFINGALTILWAMGFGMLTWNLSGTLSHTCDIANWDHEIGIMVCRIYKACEAFTVLGLLFTAASLALDFHVIRQTRQRGVYNQMGGRLGISGLDSKRGASTLGLRQRSVSPSGRGRSPAGRDELSPPLRTGGSMASGMSDGIDETLARGSREPSLEFPEYSHEVKRPYKVNRPADVQSQAYAPPEEQTSYSGAASRMLDHQFNEEGA